MQAKRETEAAAASMTAALKPIFEPKSVAVIGATEKAGSVGRTLFWNLLRSPFGGTVYPVNPKRASVLGVRACPRLSEIPEPVDLAVIITPATTVPGLVRECVDAGTRTAIVISAGFKETGPEGAELERKVLETAREGNLRIIGPNCLGVICPVSGLNASFAGGTPRKGNVAFISQSGALGCAGLDWSMEQKVGFSAFVSVGSMLDIDWGDLIDYFGEDPNTTGIALYMESIGNARSFLAAAGRVARRKPIIVIKAGRTEAAAKAAASHTGALTGSDDVIEAAFRRVGVVRVDTMTEFYDLTEALAKQPLPMGDGLTIVTNAGGPGVLATDALVSRGGRLAELSSQTIQALNEQMPAQWSHGNPVDILGDAPAERYAKALEIAARDPNTGGLLAILTPQSVTEPTETARLLTRYAQIDGKPVFASWMGGPAVRAGVDLLNQARIPTFAQADRAATAFHCMCRYRKGLESLHDGDFGEDPLADRPIRRAAALGIVDAVREQGRTLLTEEESKRLLEAYGIPTTPIEVAADADAAVEAAGRIGYPVVVKLHSTTITHKTDVGGVKLDLADAEAVREAWDAIRASVGEKADPAGFEGVTVQPMACLDGYELILGGSVGAQFGPVMLFGMGGQLVEVFKDSSLGLPPLTMRIAQLMIEDTKISRALRGVRGRRSVDMAALKSIMVRFSRLMVEIPRIRESDINPLIASADQLLALDARFVLHDPEVAETDLPRAVLAEH